MIRSVCILVGLSCLGGPAIAQSPERELLNALSKQLGCASSKSMSGLRVWCLGPRVVAKGKTPAPLRDSRALIGLTVELERGKSVRQALLNKVHLSVLALRKAGNRSFGKITSITPSNEGEKMSLAKAIFNVAAVLKGRAKHAVLEKRLHGYVSSLPRRATYPVSVKGGEWRIAGASDARLRQLGSIWVSVEVPKARNGIFLSIFTSRFSSH